MKRTVPRLKGAAKEVARGELIGLPVAIVAANDEGLRGREGLVVDETMKTLTVQTDARSMRIPKCGCTFSFHHPHFGPTEIPGDAIRFRPEDRTKKVR